MQATTIGIDLAKNVFQVHGVDSHGKKLFNKALKREQMAAFFVNLPPALVGMEVCGSSHHWARKLQSMGHTVRLMAPQFVKPYVKGNKRGRPPFAVETMLRVHFMQQWFTLSDPAMEEALHDMPLFREFAGLNWDTAVPDGTTILRFRRLLEDHKLAPQILALVNELLGAKGLLLRAGTVVDATLIAAPSSTKNASGERDPEMKQSKKGNQWFFGMKAHIGVDADSGLVHTVRGTTGSVKDVVEANSLLHGDEIEAWGDAGYQGAAKRPDARGGVRWNIAMYPGKRRALDKYNVIDALINKIEKLKAGIRAKVEHPFRVIKRQFGHVKVRYRGLKKNTAQLHTLFALSNLWMVRHKLMVVQA